MAVEVGEYRARLERPDGSSRKLRLLLFAAAPDRLHAEILSPLGAPAMIVDGGDGRLSIALPRRRTAYVGAASAASVERLLGIPVDLGELVRALTGGEAPPGWDLSREPLGPGLPDTFAVAREGHRVELELRRRRSARLDPRAVGTGVPPSGLEVRPIAELGGDPLEELGEP